MSRKQTADDFPRYTPPPVVLPDDDAATIPELRAFAAMVWNEFTEVFGNSMTLIHMVRAPRKLFRMANDWLRHLELFVRRFIIIVAGTLALAPVKPRPSSRGKADPAVYRRSFAHWADPTSWRVSFRILPSGPRDPQPYSYRRNGTRPIRATGLARRIEALRRVLSYHEFYAHRFARSLARIRNPGARRNLRPDYGVKPWVFHPNLSSRGAHAIKGKMPLANAMCERTLARMQALEPRPG